MVGPTQEQTKDSMDDRLSGVLQLMIFRTPLKTNMEPENEGLEEEIPFGSHHVISFSGSMLVFGGVDHF